MRTLPASGWAIPVPAALLRLASWALGIGGLLLLLVMLDRLLSEEMLDVGYSLLALQVTSPVRYSVLKALSCLPALALLLIPALIFLFIPLPGLAPIPALFCGYFGCLGLFSLLLIRLGKMPGVTGSLSFSAANPNLRRVLTGLGSFAAVLLISLMLHFSGLYTLRFSLDRLPAFLLCGIAAALGTAGWLYDAMLLDQCKFPLPLRLCLELLPFLPYAGLAFLAIPGLRIHRLLHRDPAHRRPGCGSAAGPSAAADPRHCLDSIGGVRAAPGHFRSLCGTVRWPPCVYSIWNRDALTA